MNYLNLTWRNVLDSYAPSRQWNGHISSYLPLVNSVGYDYFNWNGEVYKLIRNMDKSLDYERTGILVENL